jgi:ubiquinone/menaquinone biosynthesis C-methylase UbiE
MLRNSYSQKIIEMGAVIFPGDTIVDMGCGTGTSTRRLAELFKQAGSVVGIDLSPQMIAVGRFLQERREDGFTWVEKIEPDARIRFQYDCIEETGLSDGSVALVSLCLVLHELPREATLKILREVHRILRPGGKLVIMEMDPEAPGYIKLRSNPLLFSVLRSTEPFLDEYFDLAPSLPKFLTEQIGFSDVRIAAATGRHFAIVATKGGLLDLRPSSEERLKSDEHVATIRRQI